jgi:hypothetical protein
LSSIEEKREGRKEGREREREKITAAFFGFGFSPSFVRSPLLFLLSINELLSLLSLLSETIEETLSYIDHSRKLCSEIGKGTSTQKRRKEGAGVFPFRSAAALLSLTFPFPPLSLPPSLSPLKPDEIGVALDLLEARSCWLVVGGALFRGVGAGRKRGGERFFFFFFPFFDLFFLQRTGHGEQCDHPHEEKRERDDGEALGVHCFFFGGGVERAK